MSEDTTPFSLAPNRIFIDGRQVDSTPPPWEPPAQGMSPMRVNGEFLPAYEAPEAAEVDPGAEQKANDENAYWRLLDRHYDRSRADYTGQQEDRKLNEDMLRIRQLRHATARDWLHPWELKQGPAPRLVVPPAVDRRADRQR